MRALKSHHVEPADGWVYPVPETRFEIEGASFDDLLENVRLHLKANNFAVPVDLAAKIEDHIAMKLPERYSVERTP